MRTLLRSSSPDLPNSNERRTILDNDAIRAVDDLARSDQPARYFPAVDGLRGILAIGTILMHVNRSWFPGAPAVMDIFFVVSGFLITLLLLNNIHRDGKIELKVFWARRFKRLYPMLAIVVSVYLVLGSFLIDHPARLYADGIETLLYVSNWTKLYNYVYPPLFAHSWSLSIEEQFYLLWPLLLTVLLRWGISAKGMLVTCLCLASITLIWRNYLIGSGVPWSRIYYGLDTRVDGFLLGGVLAMLWQRSNDMLYRKRWLNIAWQGCFLALFVLVMNWNPWEVQYFAWQQSVIILLSCGTLVALASPFDTPVKRLLSSRPLRQLGLMCYGIYLWHWPIVWLLVVRTHLKPLAVLGVVLPTTLALAYLSYRYIESPILSRRSRAA